MHPSYAQVPMAAVTFASASRVARWGVLSLLAAAPAAAQVQGEVRYQGPPPRAQSIDMGSDPACRHMDPHGRSQALRITEGGVADVFAYLVVTSSVAPSPKKVQLHLKGCQFRPRVVGLQVGQKLEIHNLDHTLHSLRIAGAEPTQARRLAAKGARTVHRFDAPAVMAHLLCDVHPWERAFVGVVAHPHHAVSDEQGRLRLPIEGLADGTYKVRLWHEQLGTQTTSVVIKDGVGRFKVHFGPA